MKYSATKVPAILKSRSTESLLDIWEETSRLRHTPEIPIMRAWLMDVIEERNPAGFEVWLDKDCRDETLRNYILA